MAKILDMPKLSPTMEEGVLSTWHKNEGDAIDVDDLLADVETDKATMEFRSFDKGTILKVLVPAGSQVKLGQPVAILGNQGEDIGNLLAQVGGGASAPEPKGPEPKAAGDSPGQGAAKVEGGEASVPEDAPPAAAARGATEPPPSKGAEETAAPEATRYPRVTMPAPAPRVTSGSVLTRTEREGGPAEVAVTHGANGARTNGNGGGRVLASPYVRKTARDRGIDLRGVQGSGPGGRIQPQDLDAAPKEAAPAPAAAKEGFAKDTGAKDTGAKGPTTPPTQKAPGAGVPGLAAPDARPLSMMRKTIARRLTESKQTVPHFYLTIDVDATALLAFREQINTQLASSAKKDEDKPVKISVNDLLIKACATALRRVPECNAQYTADAILVHNRVDISVAVAIPDGLVTPVLRDADTKSVVRIAEEVRDLASRAKAKKLRPEEMQDGTFSISNLGMFGIDEFAAVINPPEGAILAVGQARDEAVVKDGAVVAGKKMAMTLSCDHRVVDGAVGARFLAELRALLEQPLRILTG